jgi:hypothetical protein
VEIRKEERSTGVRYKVRVSWQEGGRQPEALGLDRYWSLMIFATEGTPAALTTNSM